MRILFGAVGLLVVVLIVGLLARQQLRSVRPVAGLAASSAEAGVPSPALSPQRQAADEVKKALDAGMQRNREALDAGK